MTVSSLTYPVWEPERAQEWGAHQPWLIGCNYAPAYAINQLEFWQEETFDPKAIETELDLAEGIGFNTLRVYLHDLLWRDGAAFLSRLDTFLGIANARGMRTLFVFFDSCWYPFPLSGPQRSPEPGVHNSGWVQSPGVPILRDPARFDALEAYVSGVTAHFREDARVLGWDVWNEPDNPNTSSYGTRDLGDRKPDTVLPLLAKAFDWVRSARPTQPVTCGLWHGAWEEEKLNDFHRFQRDASDVISYHCYDGLDAMKRRVDSLPGDRPLLCTEYMARGAGSTFEGILPYLKERKIGAYNWGFVQGRTQTHLPWDSWQRPYVEGEPDPWFHEIFRADHTPYRSEETDLIRAITT
ncbi:MAG: cellulase family glycosylhydrolase [Capsulimonadales bacterium]|nr:cellulase family glycosylhydrolase [Capsulimonadales bacterium]